ncbi:hypothetical protein PILCRDRAFT_826039 [Piloderma croceum F 1598]|uniref:Uncharacterized protein n=1 Tax=Piloderma croceum (strain F 1598) TaxID=765440 RepID=A0A0C3FAR1_PILCF|nr:hypothetical protein PILCRDRAFT_826039 [Piloderma croceum F 1598]
MKTLPSMVFESSKSECLSSAHESKRPSVNRRTVQRTTIAAGKSKAVIEDLHVPMFEFDDENESDNIADDDEEPGDVSMVVLPSTSTDYEKSIDCSTALVMSPFYRLRSDSSPTPNRSFISGAFTSPGASSISTTTSISHESVGDDKFVDEEFTTSKPLSMEWNAKIRAWERGIVKAEVGMIAGKTRREAVRESREAADTRAQETGVKIAFKSLPLTGNTAPKVAVAYRHSRNFEKFVRKIIPNKRSSKCPVPTPQTQQSEISLPTAANPLRSPGWALPDDLPVGPDKVGPWKLYVPGIGLVNLSNTSVASGENAHKTSSNVHA